MPNQAALAAETRSSDIRNLRVLTSPDDPTNARVYETVLQVISSHSPKGFG